MATNQKSQSSAISSDNSTKYNQNQQPTDVHRQINKAAVDIILQQHQRKHDKLLLETALTLVNSLIENLGYHKSERTETEPILHYNTSR